MNRTLVKNQQLRIGTTAVCLMLMIAQRIYAVTLNTEVIDVMIDGKTVAEIDIENAEEHHTGHSGEEFEAEGNFWVNLSVVLFCTCTAGLMSGLTIGLAAVDRLALEVDSIGNREIKKMTERIFPVIDQHHWMLVTLLLCNAGAMETLPIFLDRMVSPVAAIMISVSLILIFGEVIPQAICTGPYQLEIAYWMCPVVLVIMWVTSPVSWPIAHILDRWLGEHTFQRYDNDQLKKLVQLHSISALRKIEDHIPDHIDGLTIDQAKMIEGAITFQQEHCEEVMTKISKVTFALELDAVLTSAMLKKIKSLGYSRIPIVQAGNETMIIAMLLTKSLIGLDISEQKTLKQLYQEKELQIKVPLYLHKTCTLGRMIKSFQNGHSHMAIICNTAEGAAELREYADAIISDMQHQNSMESSQNLDQSTIDLTKEVIGIVTLENVIERILLTEIHDEKDREEVMNLLQQKIPTVHMKEIERRIDTSDNEIFKGTPVMDYYNALLADVQKTIAACQQDAETKISVTELAGMGGSTSRFGKPFKSMAASDDSEFEMPTLKRKLSRS